MFSRVPDRRSHDYIRHGTIGLIAAPNTATGKVVGELSTNTWAVDFRDFLDEIDRQAEPGLPVHVMCDNKAPAVHKWLVPTTRPAALRPDLRLVDQQGPRRMMVHRTGTPLAGPRRVLLRR